MAGESSRAEGEDTVAMLGAPRDPVRTGARQLRWELAKVERKLKTLSQVLSASRETSSRGHLAT